MKRRFSFGGFGDLFVNQKSCQFGSNMVMHVSSAFENLKTTSSGTFSMHLANRF
ncbi:hypothetical protein [Cohaesibacter sp. ES.047]|uniref:hypothetical protein n=1 Tax=Cohaesibacter sp. ES.047 TaxID=1798205 RepID=UPI0012FD73DB|nr:hypothetical protein [Cohaesibacter sp. ES.047]